MYNGLLQKKRYVLVRLRLNEEIMRGTSTILYTTEYLQDRATRVTDSASTRSYEIDVGSITVGWRA